MNRQFILPIHRELVVDLFAGGGGASTGIEQAIGRHVDIAVNHDPEAVSLHEANHPQTRHFVSDVFEVDPLTVTDGQPVGLLWASPDCKHFSKAKGGKPVSKKIRGLAWVVVKWAKAVRPRVICLENVEEFQTWGPLGSDDLPCPQRKGQTFAMWKKQLQNLGYTIEHRELRACDYGAPTIRKRLFLVARRDGQPIVWPSPTHAKPDANGKVPKGMKPWRTAAECIDWSIPCPSIFERTKPLADATCRRIAKGIMRYVVEAAQPFIVQYHSAKRPGDDRTASIHTPLPTQTTENRFAVVSAFLAKHFSGAVGSDLNDPLHTVTAVDHHSLVTVKLEKNYGRDSSGTSSDNRRHIKSDADRGSLEAGSENQIRSENVSSSTPNGERLETGLSDRQAATQWPAVSDECSSTDMVAVQRADTREHGHQPYRRKQEEQQFSQLGDRHPIGQSSPRVPNGPARCCAQHSTQAAGSNGRTSQGIAGSGDVIQPDRSETWDLTNTGISGRKAQINAFLIKFYSSGGQDQPCTDPMHTIPTKDRLGLVMVHGEPWAIVDIGLRMLTPRELYRAQGFPASYQIEHGAAGEAITKTAQVRMCGNSVCPPLSQALVAANYREIGVLEKVA